MLLKWVRATQLPGTMSLMAAVCFTPVWAIQMSHIANRCSYSIYWVAYNMLSVKMLL